MKEIHSNINIIGGGLIGLATAYSLSELGLKTTVLERKSLNISKKKHIDYRTVAISEGTKNFLDKIGIWRYIEPKSQFIKKIKVIDRKLDNQLDFDNQRRSSNLGYIVENSELLNIFYQKLKKRKNTKIIDNININNIKNEDDQSQHY